MNSLPTSATFEKEDYKSLINEFEELKKEKEKSLFLLKNFNKMKNALSEKGIFISLNLEDSFSECQISSNPAEMGSTIHFR